MELKIINVAKDFTRFPAGRYKSDGPFSGERFREEILAPALKENDVLEVNLDGVAGYGSSFLDEAFGGLVRKNLLTASEVQSRIRLKASDESLVAEVLGYMAATSAQSA